MNELWFTCKCSYGKEIYMVGEGTYICPMCKKEYRRWYNSKTQMYEFYEVNK